ncbi:hypothetical protein J6590_105078, partial [Homalodisca vitripennis]
GNYEDRQGLNNSELINEFAMSSGTGQWTCDDKQGLNNTKITNISAMSSGTM